MKKRYIFSLAALALLTAACSSDEMALNPADQPSPVEQKIPFTAVISADAAGTRALTEASDGKTITAKWEKEEKVALIHGEIIDVLEVSNVDATSGAATISGTITNAKAEEDVYVVYVGHQHVNMSNYVSRLQEKYTSYKADNPESSAIPTSIISEPVNELLATQDGTLETISNKHDYRFARSTFAVSDGTATFASEVKMPASYAIWKLNLTTDGTTALKANKLVMQKDGEADVTIDLGKSTSSEFYIAFIPSSEANAYSFEATDSDDKTYSCTPTVSSALAAGKYYRSTLKMTAGNTYVDYSSGTATTKNIPSDAVIVKSTTTAWSNDVYVVKSDVTISGDVTIDGPVDLILCDGATLTINGHIWGGETYATAQNGTLYIYGQENGTGKLELTCTDAFTFEDEVITSAPIGIRVEDLIVNGCVVNSTTTKSSGIAINASSFMLYGGKVTADSSTGADSQAIEIDNQLSVLFSGSLMARGNMEGIMCNGASAVVKVEGGKLEAYAGQTSVGSGGWAIQGKLSVFEGGEVVLYGGDAKAESNASGGHGIDGSVYVKAGKLVTTGGAGDGEGSNGSGISGTIELGDGIHLYTGTVSEPNPSSANPDETGPDTIDPAPESRYVVIQ